MMLMDKKKSPALMIVSGMKEEGAPEKSRVDMEHIKLAAYELAEKAGLNIENMDSFLRAWILLHDYVHQYQDMENHEMENMEY